MDVSNLPRLLYIGDVPIESTVAGSSLIYRLLEQYPPSQLQIVEGNIAVSQPKKRLPQVSYQVLNVGIDRLLHSRLTPVYKSYLLLTARQRASQLVETVQNFRPEAILTVTHGFSWLTAAEIASKFQLPLNVIVHDDALSLTRVLSWYRPRFDRQIKTVYQQARSRLCVSPYMVEAYAKRYGVTGSVLYPSRAKDVGKPDVTSIKTTSSNNSLTFVYAGSLHSPGQVETLTNLASVLEKFNSQLVIYSSLTSERADKIGLNRHNVRLHPLVPYQTLIHNLRNEVDVMFAPMDFDRRYQTHVQLCFPSKLTDYTATGLPLLIWGPSYCSAVRWAQENPGVAEVVKTKNKKDLAQAVAKLVKSADYRHSLAQKAALKGYEYFAYNNVVGQFYESIRQKEKVLEALL